MDQLLLLEDDQNLGMVVSEHLYDAGFETLWAKTIAEAKIILQNHSCEIGILDVMLPDGDGFTFCKEIRTKYPHLPIIFLTARSLHEDLIYGFKSGADDYLTKPFSMEELLLRLNALLRRAKNTHKQDIKLLKIGLYTFDASAMILQYQSDPEQKLTEKEAALLKIFASSQNEVIKRADLLLNVWGKNDYFMGRSLDVFISRLRKYLQKDPNIHIENYHGIGFMLRNIEETQ